MQRPDRQQWDIETDKSHINDRLLTSNPLLQEVVLKHLNATQAEFENNQKIQLAVQDLMRQTLSGVPLRELCLSRLTYQRLLSNKNRRQLNSNLETATKEIRGVIDEYRDYHTMLLPHRIIKHAAHRYNGAPWYAASFVYNDPESGVTGSPHIAFIRTKEPIAADGEDLPPSIFKDQNVFANHPVTTRIHSECFLGDMSGISQARCDCGEQLRDAFDTINEEGEGVVMYLRQEGRGVDLREKMELLELADGRREGKWIGGHLDTESAMHANGFEESDFRQFGFVGKAYRGLGVDQMKLLTGNPKKALDMSNLGFKVTIAEAAGVAVTTENLVEFLYKLMRGYEIKWESLVSIGKHIDRLHEGHRIDDALFNRLRLLWTWVKEQSRENVPAELVAMLEKVQEELEN